MISKDKAVATFIQVNELYFGEMPSHIIKKFEEKLDERA